MFAHLIGIRLFVSSAGRHFFTHLYQYTLLNLNHSLQYSTYELLPTRVCHTAGIVPGTGAT